MDEKTKLYIFSKKEVALIFLFMFLIALTSFVFGVKVGKSYSYRQAGFSPQDREVVDLLSGQEEAVNDVVRDSKRQRPEMPEMQAGELEDLNKKLEEHIKTETEAPKKKKDSSLGEAGEGQREESKLKKRKKEGQKERTQPLAQESKTPLMEEGEGASSSETKESPSLKDKYSGKYTIQLGSHRSLNEAESFAEGFRVRGYNPIITEKEISGRGIWYRVSLGAFETITEAKEYVKAEDSLFQGQEYVFVRFE